MNKNNNDDVEAPIDRKKLREIMPNLPKNLTLDEKKYLLAIERGDMPNVRRILQRAQRKKDLDINCVDSLGRGALTIAIDQENLEMIELLIILGVETKDALLHAINAEFVEAVELLLEHEELIHKEGELYSWQTVDLNMASFTPDITPLVLAAHRNNYEILKILLDRGATVPLPHDIKCGCDECIKESAEDSLRHSLSRLNEYRALASPSLIALSSSDPILTAFQLSWDLRNLAFAEPECKSEYMELRKQCQQFAVDLLHQSRSSQELAIILNHDPESPPYKEGEHMKLARLELAIEYKQKKFVAHPNIQQLLAAIWYEGVPGFRRKSALQKLGIISKVALLFPFYCLFYMVAPETRSGKLMRKPFMKFLIHASSYLFFLLLLILVSQRAEDQIIDLFGTEAMRERLPEHSGRFRGNPPSILEYVVLLYVIGFIYEETVEMYVTGFRSYLKNLWNFIDFTRNFLYTAVFVLRFAAYIHQTSEIATDPSTAFIRREDWQAFDPQLIAEGLFAGANIFSALKLVHLFSINPHLGPLQISLGRMVIDIVKFFFIYSLVLFAFACGLNQLLWYFSDLERKKCYHLPNGEPDHENEGEACVKWRRFANVFESSQSLFWASFGMINISDFELTGIKTYTRFWGLLMFGSYSVINVIVLLNLLIAMMSNSYAMIDEHSDIEWKFARTKLWMSYFEEACTLPSPFNLCPQFKLFLKVFGLRKKDKLRRMSTKRKSRVEKERDYKYTAVMRALVWRYICSMHKKIEENAVTEDDVSELKGDISSFRYELLDVLQKNGMDISSAEKKDKAVLGKKMKIWERRLMKDFKVGPVSAEEEHNLIFQDPPSDEDSLSRFRRVAKLAVLDSSLHKWRQVVKGACIASQIGKCHNRDSFRKQQNLQKAIQEAKKLADKSPGISRAVSPIELPDTVGTSIIKVMEDYVIEEQNGKATETLSKFKMSRSPQNTNDRNVEANVKISLRPPPSKREQKNKSQAPLPGPSHDHAETSNLINLESQKSSPVDRNSSNSLSSACEEIEQILRQSEQKSPEEGRILSPPSIILSPPKLESNEIISMKRDATGELSQKSDNETVLIGKDCDKNLESKPEPESKISESVEKNKTSDVDISNVQSDEKENSKEGVIIKTSETHTVNGIKDISEQEVSELDKKSNSQDLQIAVNKKILRDDSKLMEEKAPEVKLTTILNIASTLSTKENVDSAEGPDKATDVSNFPLKTKQDNPEVIINDPKKDTIIGTEVKKMEPTVPDNAQTVKEGEASDNSKLTVETQPMVKSPLSERNIYRVRAKSPYKQPKYGWL